MREARAELQRLARQAALRKSGVSTDHMNELHSGLGRVNETLCYRHIMILQPFFCMGGVREKEKERDREWKKKEKKKKSTTAGHGRKAESREGETRRNEGGGGDLIT